MCECGAKSKTLICKHSFCTPCIKEWFLKAEEAACPMCRGPLFFRGFRKSGWVEAKYDKESTVMGTIIDQICDDFSEIAEQMGRSRVMMRRWARVTMEEMRMAESTCNILKLDGCTDDEIYDAIDDGVYLSPKVKYYYIDEPKICTTRKQFKRQNLRLVSKGRR
jgi:hypothetical protein